MLKRKPGRPPTETKVIAARATAGGFTLIGGALVWALGVWVWGASADADKATLAVAAVPIPISALIVPGLAYLGAHLGGWLAPHTPRPDLAPPARAVPTGAPPPPPELPLDVGLDLMHTGPVPKLP